MYLVDTSSWIEFLRTNGRPEVQKRLHELLKARQAAWCQVVRLELWNGARSDSDVRQLTELETYLTMLDITADVWNESVALARRTRGKGLTVPMPDVIIAACARHHGVEVESIDLHFKQLAKLQ